MGYDPQGNFGPPKEEPTSPQPPPPGPIPMTCSPNFLQQPGKPDKTIEENSSPAQHTSKDVTDAPASHRSSNTQIGESDKHASRKTSTESGTGEGVHIVPISVQDEEETNSTTVPSCEKGDEEMPIDPAMEKLQKVKHEVAELVEKIESFNGSKDNKEYLYLDEMLTRHMLSLDSIEAAGRDDIRQIRKDTIRSINRCLSTLDARASGEPNTSDNKDADDNNAIIDELAAISNTKEK
jgi:hypothetical protein